MNYPEKSRASVPAGERVAVSSTVNVTPPAASSTVRVLWVAAAALLLFGGVEQIFLDVSWSVAGVRAAWAALVIGVALALPRVTPRARSLALVVVGAASPLLFAALLVLRQDLTGVSFAFFLATPFVFAVLLRGEVGAVTTSAIMTLVVGATLFDSLPGTGGDVTAWWIGSVAAGGLAVYSSALFGRMARLADQLHVEQVRAVEARAQEAVARAEVERGALLRQVAAGLAHEINNPLAAVVANLGFLEQASGPAATADDRAEVEEALHATVASAGRVADVVRRLQALAPPPSIESGSCDAVAVLRALLADLPLPTTFTLYDHMPPSTPLVAAPATELRRILQQLATASLDVLASQAQPAFALEARERDLEIELVLRDNGRIDRAAGDDAAPFGLRARGRDSGLGLMLAREACRKWGGVVEVARADGGGEQITVRLPRLVDTSGR